MAYLRWCRYIYTHLRINKISDCELKWPPSPQPTPQLTHNHCFFGNTARPTEVPEFDVYICESKYHELEHSIKRLGKGLKVSDSPASSHTISLSLPPILSLISLSVCLSSLSPVSLPPPSPSLSKIPGEVGEEGDYIPIATLSPPE